MDKKRKAADIRYTEVNMRIKSDYDPDFVAAIKRGTTDRDWDRAKKEWVINLKERKVAMSMVERFYDVITELNKPPEERKKRRRKPSPPPGSYIGVERDRDYMVLHLLPTAPPEVVNAAYKALAKMHHPDTSKLPDANTKMISINRAYRAIMDRTFGNSF